MVKVNSQVNKNQGKHKISKVFAKYSGKSSKTNLCSYSITTVVAKYLSSALDLEDCKNLLQVLFDSDSEGRLINQKWTTFGKNTKIVSPTPWITGAGTLSTKGNRNLKFKLDELSTSREVEWTFHADETEMSKKRYN